MKAGTAAITLLLLMLTWPASSYASCAWEFPEHLFVLPEDQAENVPVDARIWINATLGTARVFVGDQELEARQEGRSWFSFEPTITPGQELSFEVKICEPEAGDCRDYGPYSFTAGSAAAAAPTLPVLEGLEALSSEGNFENISLPEDLCTYQLLSQDCFDVGPMYQMNMQLVQDDGAALYSIRLNENVTPGKEVKYSYLSTPDCRLQYITGLVESSACGPVQQESCGWVQAINLAGERSEEVKLCATPATLDGEPWPVSPCQAEQDLVMDQVDSPDAAAGTPSDAGAAQGNNATESSGCTASASGKTSPAVLFLLVLALLSLRRAVSGWKPTC